MNPDTSVQAPDNEPVSSRSSDIDDIKQQVEKQNDCNEHAYGDFGCESNIADVLPSPKSPPPPIPERVIVEHIAKAYTLGYDNIDLEMEEELNYGNQSYIEDEVMARVPSIPKPLNVSTLHHSPPKQDSVPMKPTAAPPLPPVFDMPESESFKGSTIDELIGLAPGKEERIATKSLLKKVQQSVGNGLSKVKGQTSSAISRILHKSSNEDEEDFLGIYQDDSSSLPSSTTTLFDSSMDFVHVDENARDNSNDDVGELFGIVSFDEEVEEGSASDPENCNDRQERKSLFSSEDDRFELIVHELTMSRQITKKELGYIQQAAQHDKKNTERIIQSYIGSGISIEYNKILHRTTDSLPKKEMRVKILKDSQGNRFEVKHLQGLTLSVPKLFVFQDTFFYLIELRLGKLNFLNKWSSCIVQLQRHQLRIYRTLADISPDNTLFRINLHSLMNIGSLMKKPYKNCMYYYIKLFENDLGNYRVVEEHPDHFRRDLSSVQVLKVGCKEEMVLRALAYQLKLRLKALTEEM